MSTPNGPLISGAWRTVLKSTYLGRDCYNSLAVIDSSPTAPSAARAQAIAETVYKSWAEKILTWVSPSVVLTECVAYSLQDPTMAGVWAGTEAGRQALTGTGPNPISSALCANVTLSTGRRGRAYRGRTGIVGLMEQHISGNTIDGTHLGNLQAGVNQFLADLAAIGQSGDSGTEVPVELAVVSETYGLATRVTSAVVRPTVGTRVSRLR